MRILLVDDEPSLLQLLGQYLTRQGHEVLPAATLALAMQTALSQPVFDAAVIDLTLPDGSGEDLARSLARSHPATTFIIATGFAYDAPKDLRERVTVLQKPFAPRALLDLLGR